MAKYFVEYGALQANAKRLIECDTSANPAVKVSEKFAKQIAYALNQCEPGAKRYVPSKEDIDKLDELADNMINSSQYGGGIIKRIAADYRQLRQELDEYEAVERDCNGDPLPSRE